MKREGRKKTKKNQQHHQASAPDALREGENKNENTRKMRGV